MGRGHFGPGGQVVLKKKIFECFIVFFMYFYGSNPGPMGRGHFGPGGQVVLKKKIFECFFFFMYFYGSNPGPMGRGHFGPGGHHTNKLGSATYKIPSI